MDDPNKNIMKIAFSLLGLGLLLLSQLLMSFGYDYLMSQRPVDFAHWSMLLSAVLLFSMWFTLPENITKPIGLVIMTLGIAGMIGMCTIDFLLWAAHDDPSLKENLFKLISKTPSLNLPFLIIGPSLFYGGICIATYGLIKKYTWEVVLLNTGGLLIGLGHMIFENRIIPVLGALMLMIGLTVIIYKSKKD